MNITARNLTAQKRGGRNKDVRPLCGEDGLPGNIDLPKIKIQRCEYALSETD